MIFSIYTIFFIQKTSSKLIFDPNTGSYLNFMINIDKNIEIDDSFIVQMQILFTDVSLNN